MGAAVELDPITVEVIGKHLLAIAEEMEVILVKASYSTNIKERRDASTALPPCCASRCEVDCAKPIASRLEASSTS